MNRQDRRGPIVPRDRSQNGQKAPMARQNRHFGQSTNLASQERQGSDHPGGTAFKGSHLTEFYRIDNKPAHNTALQPFQ